MGMEGMIARNDITLIRGRAYIKSPTEIDVGGTFYETTNTILATGSIFDIPDVPGLKEAAIIPDDVLEMTEVPRSVLIWGFGPVQVALEILRTARCGVPAPTA